MGRFARQQVSSGRRILGLHQPRRALASIRRLPARQALGHRPRHDHRGGGRLGATVWRSSSSLTGTYTLHVSRGDYLSLSLGYVRGPALSPRVSGALVFTANWSLYL
jgi:hypothetical protein